jgi:hypothetical protein
VLADNAALQRGKLAARQRVHLGFAHGHHQPLVHLKPRVGQHPTYLPLLDAKQVRRLPIYLAEVVHLARYHGVQAVGQAARRGNHFAGRILAQLPT